MHHVPRSALLVLTALSLVAGAGCGTVSEKAGEKIAEKAIEAGSGGNAKVDLGGGGVVVETDEGTYRSDGEGNVRIETEDGTYTAGTGELPEGWPAEIPLPDDLEIVSSSAIGADGQQMLSVIGTTSLDPASAVDLVTAGLAGWETASTLDVGGDSIHKSVHLSDGGDRTLDLAAMSNAGEDTTTLTYSYLVDSRS